MPDPATSYSNVSDAEAAPDAGAEDRSAAPSECDGTGDALCCGGDEAPKADGEGQPCPVPLQWHQVVEAFRADARPIVARRGGRSVSGWVIGEGPPVYFLNGLGGSHELLTLFAWLMKEEFTCILFDWSDPAPSSRTPPAGATPGIAGYAEDLFALAAERGDARWSLYAVGFSVPVALTAMSLAPDRIERAALQNGYSELRLSMFERLAISLGRRMPGRLKHLPGRSAAQRQSHLPWFPPFDSTRWRFFADDTGATAARSLAKRAGTLVGCRLASLLPAIQAPVLLIGSEGEGRVLRAARESLQAGLPSARSEWMFGCGHLPYLTHPHRLSKLVLPFFKGEAPPETETAPH